MRVEIPFSKEDDKKSEDKYDRVKALLERLGLICLRSGAVCIQKKG
jgi:hypothetical protein